MITQKQESLLSLIYACPYAIPMPDCLLNTFRNDIETFNPTHFCRKTKTKDIGFLLDRHIECSAHRSITETKTKIKNEKKIHLTNREKEVAKLICLGLSNTKMAERLSLTLNTIKTHRNNLYHKLKVNSTGSLIKALIKKGLYSK